jgi:hypothetical protein
MDGYFLYKKDVKQIDTMLKSKIFNKLKCGIYIVNFFLEKQHAL